MKNVSDILADIIALVLSGGSSTTALSLRTLFNEIVNSFSNFKTGGKLFEVEVGYKDAFRPSSAGAFATVDMIGGSSVVVSTTTIALLTNASNWTNNQYTGATALTGQKAGDWYITSDYDYKFITGTTVRRIYYPLT
jgi:hypothetical protein